MLQSNFWLWRHEKFHIKATKLKIGFPLPSSSFTLLILLISARKWDSGQFIFHQVRTVTAPPTPTLKPYKPCLVSSSGLINSCPFMLERKITPLDESFLCGLLKRWGEREGERERHLPMTERAISQKHPALSIHCFYSLRRIFNVTLSSLPLHFFLSVGNPCSVHKTTSPFVLPSAFGLQQHLFLYQLIQTSLWGTLPQAVAVWPDGYVTIQSSAIYNIEIYSAA